MKLNPLLSYYKNDNYYYFYNKYDKNKSIIFKSKEILPEKINKFLYNKIGVNVFLFSLFLSLLILLIDTLSF